MTKITERKWSMLVELKKMGERPIDAGRSYERPVEIHHSAEMKPEEFAFKYASALLHDTSLNSEPNGYYIGDMAVFAVIFGEDPTPFRGEENTSGANFSHSPRCVEMNVICDGKLVQITIGPNDQDEHYFFRVTESGLVYLPYGTGCRVLTTAEYQIAHSPGMTVRHGNEAWPWITLFPEKFSGLIEFASILCPDDENPLTGLLSSRDTPVRTLAKQIASRLTVSRDKWVRDIVANL